MNFRAKAMAMLEGAESAATMGIRATTTLCIISKPGKPKNVKEVLLKLKI